MPKTKSGIASLVLILASPILMILGLIAHNVLYDKISSGDTILEDVFRRPLLAIPMLAGIASGAIAFFFGMTAILKDRERSVLVFAATAVGGLFVLFITGEILFPH